MNEEYYFTGGKTPPETFPSDELAAISGEAIKRLGGAFAFYPRQHEYALYSDKGYVGLREVASIRYERREGVPLPIENIVITNGSMQAIELIGRAFFKPGDVIITEELTYYGSLEFFRYMDVNIVGIPVDDIEGMHVDELEDTLRRLERANMMPRFIYTIPNHHNPTGAIMTSKRRKRLVDTAMSYGIPIIEDDCYGDIDFEKGIIPRSLNTIDQAGNVLYIGSFSKIVGPGVRLGYLSASDKYLEEVLMHRWDLGTSVLASVIVAEFLKNNMWSHLERHIEVIKKKMNATLQALDEYLSDIINYIPPRGGLFIWIKLPEDTDMRKLELEAEKRNVRYDEGRLFHYKNEEIRAIRISYAHIPLDRIQSGIKLLSEAIKIATEH
jgi:2-aminoadipate transaminase